MTDAGSVNEQVMVFGFLPPIEFRDRDENQGSTRVVAALRSVLGIGITVATGIGRDKNGI